ncbi:MAG: GTPase domain-containing protein, partial [Planctomycetaceae bacterium]|nr:GTPase domain-containing protein [Planctomycetaceae bacterium]
MKLRLFIYGSCGAGKTSFFRQLIQGNSSQIASNQKLVKFLSNSITPSGQVVPTTTGVDGLEIKLDRDTYIVSDWKGELLSASVDELSLGNSRWLDRNVNMTANQIKTNDAILFFFDPSAQSTVESARSTDQIRKHHSEELLRAKRMIDFVLRSRQNKFVPIVFILTHCDLVEVIPKLEEWTEVWVDSVSNYLRGAYEEFFGGYYPKSLICREEIFYRVTTIRESKQPRKTPVLQSGSAPAVKVDAVNWVESFPFAVDLANILRNVQRQVNAVKIFHKEDRKRYRSIMISCVFCLCLVFFVPIILYTQQGQIFLNGLQGRISPVLDRSSWLQSMLDNEMSSASNFKLNLKPLDNPTGLDDKEAVLVNESLIVLMKKLNNLEDAKLQNTDEYKKYFAQWSEALQKIERLFDSDKFESNRVKLDLFGVILGKLSDSSSRATPQLDNVLRRYWNLYREELIVELADDLLVNRGAGSTGKQQLEMLCLRMERFFRDINNSSVRSGSFSLKSNDSTQNLKESTQKEQLKQDVRKCFKACENFLVNYPVEICFREISYSSVAGIDRDFVRRLKISGIDGNSVYVDLTISSGYHNDKVCQFLPDKDRVR